MRGTYARSCYGRFMQPGPVAPLVQMLDSFIQAPYKSLYRE